MLIWIIVIIIAVLLLGLIKTPNDDSAASEGMSDAYRRKLRKEGQKAMRERLNPPGGLPWMGNAKRNRRNKSHWG